MDLNEYLEKREIDEELKYFRQGKLCTAYPFKDCSISEPLDELAEMQKLSGSYYFYGMISCELLAEKEKVELELASKKEALTGALEIKKSSLYLLNQVELARTKARCTDKVLENMVSSNSEIANIKSDLLGLSQLKERIIELKNVENKLKIILKALLLKQEDLIEISRRKKEELKTISHLS